MDAVATLSRTRVRAPTMAVESHQVSQQVCGTLTVTEQPTDGTGDTGDGTTGGDGTGDGTVGGTGDGVTGDGRNLGLLAGAALIAAILFGR